MKRLSFLLGFFTAALLICVPKTTNSHAFLLESGSSPTAVASSQWVKTYGASDSEIHSDFDSTSDEGLVYISSTSSFGNGIDVLVVKLDSQGEIQWQRAFGSSGDEYPGQVIQTSDGGYLFTASSYAFGSGNSWIVKLNPAGVVVWERKLGSLSIINFLVEETSSNEYILAGNESGNTWVGKINTDGQLIWQKTYIQSLYASVQEIHQTSDGGFILIADLGILGTGNADTRDAWVAKLDTNGNIQWQKTYGGALGDWPSDIHQTEDGGYIFIGGTRSISQNNFDPWVVRLDSTGSIVWEKIYSAGGYAVADDLVEIDENNFLIAGRITSLDGGYAALLFEIDGSGSLSWEKAYDGVAVGWRVKLTKTVDLGYAVMGTSTELGVGSGDVIIFKVDSSGAIPECNLMENRNLTEVNINLSSSGSTSNTQITNFGSLNVSSNSMVVSAVTTSVCNSCNDMSDPDEDGIPTAWETCGYTYSNGRFVDLPAMGADPNTKDIFVEVDYMVEQGVCAWGSCAFGHSHQPKEDAISKIVQSFIFQGIMLHVDYGPETVMNPLTGEKWGQLSNTDPLPHFNTLGSSCGDKCYQWEQHPFESCSELENLTEVYFDDFKICYFNLERSPIFHYAIFAHQLEGFGCTSGISRGIPGSDFIISLGGWGPWLKDECLGTGAKIGVGTVNQQAGTFMHELGHNLGLCHGGPRSLAESENQCDVNYKPNYLSVMNYAFQTSGLFNGGAEGFFDYSNFGSLDLNLEEDDLDENTGLGDESVIATLYGTRYWCSVDKDRIDHDVSTVDWNCDDSDVDQNLAENINEGTSTTHDEVIGELKSYQDWGNLVFNYDGGYIGMFGSKPELPSQTTVDEITHEEDSSLTSIYEVNVTSVGNVTLLPGATATFTFDIVNTGSVADTYLLSVSSSEGWADLNGIPSTLALEATGSTQIKIAVNVPASANGLQEDKLVLTLVSMGNSNILDSATIRTSVIRRIFLPFVSASN